MSAQAGALVLLGNANFFNVSDGSAVMDASRKIISHCIIKWKLTASEMAATYNFFSAMTIPVPTIRPWCSITR